MNEKYLQDILMELLYCTVNGLPDHNGLKEKLTPEVIAPLYVLAGRHALGHLVSRYVFKNQIEVEPGIAGKLQQDDILCVHKHERMKYALRQICTAFDEAQIDYIPLKGVVLRAHYPDESMRTSCDIDILVREEALEQAVTVLEQKQFRRGSRNYHDISMYAPNGIHLELHFNIWENMEQLDGVLKKAWDYALPEQGNRYAFRKEFFVFHMYAHMAYHFLMGGCGIRSLMDIWIMEHRMNAAYPCAEKLLKKAGIYRFAAEMSKIANQCFTMQNPSDPVVAYIWRGGVYGTAKNGIMVRKMQTGSTRAYLRKRILLPYKSMTVSYPILKKLPVLLPLCWVHRWIKAIVRGKTRKIVTEAVFAQQVSDDQIREITGICRRLGF